MRARVIAVGGLALSLAACVVAVLAPVTVLWTFATVGGVVAGVGLVAYGLWLADRG